MPDEAGAAILAANRDARPEAILLAAKTLGLLCDGCSMPIENGFRFTRFLERFDPEAGRLVPVVKQAVVCVRDDCDAAEKVRATAHVVEPLQFVWLRDPGDDPKPPDEPVASA
jgi:hypothetical protein